MQHSTLSMKFSFTWTWQTYIGWRVSKDTRGQPGSICQVKFVFVLQVRRVELNAIANDVVVDWLENKPKQPTLGFALLKCNHYWKKNKKKNPGHVNHAYIFILSEMWSTSGLCPGPFSTLQ